MGAPLVWPRCCSSQSEAATMVTALTAPVMPRITMINQGALNSAVIPRQTTMPASARMHCGSQQGSGQITRIVRRCGERALVHGQHGIADHDRVYAGERKASEPH